MPAPASGDIGIRAVGLHPEEGVGSAEAATEAHMDLERRHKDLLFRQAALRLSVDGSDLGRVGSSSYSQAKP
jgi:hypothetical protein